MASLEKHCEESLQKFGRPFEEVHKWLDEFAGSKEFGFQHRKKRHHEKGIQQAKALFGETAASAARQHIISDLMEEGWIESDRFPKYEDDYVAMGLF